MPRPRTGQIRERDGRLYARVRWTDPEGRTHYLERRARNRTDARRLITLLLAEIPSTTAADDPTFSDLAADYLRERVQPARYEGGRKVSGMRAHRNIRNEVLTLTRYFGPLRLSAITYDRIERYKRARLATPTRAGLPRRLAGFNHELRRLKAMLNYARQRRLIASNPFADGPPLISSADEIPRTRARREGEEEALLAACTGKRAHLKAVIICALDTALRHSEILALERRDVDLKRRQLVVRATVSKTAQVRVVPVSDRLADELTRLLDVIPREAEAKLFGGIKSVRKAFVGACRDAKITDLHFHDLRSWATTDLVAGLVAQGVAPQHAMRITGHSQEKTFRRYLRTDDEVVDRARDGLEAVQRARRRRLLRRVKG